jgi:membrane-bound metal-dependent hydrolase YbcI (DUF457 family)
VYAGHAALATLAKSYRVRVPIALLVPVAFAPDWIEWFFDAIGYRNREISHSLVAVGIGASLTGLVYYLVARDLKGAAVVWSTYVSHWPADFITGLKPTWPGGPTVGFYLYTRPVADVIIEVILIVLCWIAYRRSLPAIARNRALGWLVPAGLIVMHLAFFATTNPALR